MASLLNAQATALINNSFSAGDANALITAAGNSNYLATELNAFQAKGGTFAALSSQGGSYTSGWPNNYSFFRNYAESEWYG